MKSITIIASCHIKSLNKNQDIVNALHSSDLIIQEGVNNGVQLESLEIEPWIFLFWKVYSKLPIFRDIKTSRKVQNNNRITVDADFNTLTKCFHRRYYNTINFVILPIFVLLGLVFLPYIWIGIVKSDILISEAGLFGAFMFGFLPIGLYFIYFLYRTADYRNDLVVSKVKGVGPKHSKIVIIYGAMHSKDLYNKLKSIDGYSVKIIKA